MKGDLSFLWDSSALNMKLPAFPLQCERTQTYPQKDPGLNEETYSLTLIEEMFRSVLCRTSLNISFLCLPWLYAILSLIDLFLVIFHIDNIEELKNGWEPAKSDNRKTYLINVSSEIAICNKNMESYESTFCCLN